MPITERELALKHGALVCFAKGIGSVPDMPWFKSLRIADLLANTGKNTKDLTLFEVMQAIQTVEAEYGNEVTLPVVDSGMQSLRQAVAS